MTNTTTTTLVGVFQDEATAQTVARKLSASGVPAQNIRVTGGYPSDDSASGQMQSSSEDGGGMTGFFRRIFGGDDAEDTEYYENAVKMGNAIVTVDVDESEIESVSKIMNQNGVLDLGEEAISSTKGEVKGQPMPVSSTKGEVQGQSIPVIEEELQVGKRAVQRGGIRVYSRVVEQPVEEQVTLREERIRVERRPVDRPISPADAEKLRDQTIEMTEMAEEPVVSKTARVVEEVSIAKESTERTETIRDKVRKTDVKVEKIGSQTAGSSNYDADFRKDFETRYGGSGVPYETYAPAYQFGYSSASEPRYKNKSWNDVESTLKTDYLRTNPNSTWDNIKGAVRYGWEKVTGKR